MKKFFIFLVSCFCFSSLVFADSNWTNIDLGSSQINFNIGVDSSFSGNNCNNNYCNTTTIYYFPLKSNHSRIISRGDNVLHSFSISILPNVTFNRDHAYQFQLVFEGINSEFFPYLYSFASHNYSIDMNQVFTSKTMKFCQDSNCDSYYSRDDMTWAYFSMGYEDSSTYLVYYLNLEFVSPYDFDHIVLDFTTNSSYLDSNNRSFWVLGSPFTDNFFNFDLSRSSLKEDLQVFTSSGIDYGCICDECQYSYNPDNSISDSIPSPSNINLSSILSGAWSSAKSFIQASFYVVSLCTSLFNLLPTSISSVLLLIFVLGSILLIWKLFT